MTVLNVVRATQHLAIKVTVAALVPEPEMASESSTPSGQAEAVSLGITVESMSKRLAGQYGIDEVSGVVITAVEPDSAAEESDIKPGDSVMAMGQVDAAKKTVQAMMINATDAATVAKAKENLGKTYIWGRITAIDADSSNLENHRPTSVPLKAKNIGSGTA